MGPSQPGPAFCITEATVYKWKKRTSLHDCSHTSNHFHARKGARGGELRRTLLLDGLLAVTHEFICTQATRPGLERCLRRHGVGNLNALKPVKPREVRKSFKSYEPG